MERILQKCTKEDFEYISKVLDSYFSFTNDKKRKELLAQYPNSKKELISLIDKQIRYYGSSDVAYAFRAIFSKDAGVSATEVISDVADKMKVKIKLGASFERSLEILATSIVEKEILDKKPEELAHYFKNIGIGDAEREQILSFIKNNAQVAVLPILLKVVGPEVTYSIIQSILVTVISQFIGRKTAEQLIKEVVKRNPWLNSLGPVIWVLSASWLAFDLQGTAYRKIIPICLYLGIVALRDGEEKE